MYLVDNANANVIQGNLIGVNAAGTAAIPNGRNGIRFEDSTGAVGDTGSESRNVISGNANEGIFVDDQSSNVGIRNNHIGTNQAGTAAVPNGGSGIRLSGTNHAVIENILSGNGAAGLTLISVQLVDVRSNAIGVDVTGLLPLPNAGAGISVTSANRIEIGDVSTAGRGNTVAFNDGSGVVVSADSDRIGIVDNRILSNGALGIDLLPLRRQCQRSR